MNSLSDGDRNNIADVVEALVPSARPSGSAFDTNATTTSSVFTPLIHPIINRLVPELRVLRLKHPMTFIREIQHL